MKFAMVFEAGSKTIILTPENPGEQALLGSLFSANKSIEAKDATVQGEWSDDRPPYAKITSVKVGL